MDRVCIVCGYQAETFAAQVGHDGDAALSTRGVGPITPLVLTTYREGSGLNA